MLLTSPCFFWRWISISPLRLDLTTMCKVRSWERFQYNIDYEHQQARCPVCDDLASRTCRNKQHRQDLLTHLRKTLGIIRNKIGLYLAGLYDKFFGYEYLPMLTNTAALFDSTKRSLRRCSLNSWNSLLLRESKIISFPRFDVCMSWNFLFFFACS